jgi:hypothetical protein
LSAIFILPVLPKGFNFISLSVVNNHAVRRCENYEILIVNFCIKSKYKLHRHLIVTQLLVKRECRHNNLIFEGV